MQRSVAVLSNLGNRSDLLMDILPKSSNLPPKVQVAPKPPSVPIIS